MDKGITRRDFLNGVACAIVAAGIAPGTSVGQTDSPYPPARTGYGGSRPADFAVAHGVRDGRRYDLGRQAVTEHYDVVIGAGIGGLASAYYLRRANPQPRVLILDNHDDFGGYARRNEFNVDGRLLVGYGGSESMEGPKTRWTRVARECVAGLGVDLDRFETAFQRHLYPGLGLSSGLFFPREIYGGASAPSCARAASWRATPTSTISPTATPRWHACSCAGSFPVWPMAAVWTTSSARASTTHTSTSHASPCACGSPRPWSLWRTTPRAWTCPTPRASA